MSEPYDPDNLLDRHSDPDTLQVHYEQEYRRERELLDRRLGLSGGEVLSVGCGRHPGRHLFPAPAWRMTGVDLDPALIEDLVERGELDAGTVARAGELPFDRKRLRRRPLPARAAPHRLPGTAGALLRGGGPAASPGRGAGGDRAGALASGRRRPGAREPGRPRAPGCTARPTTSRSRRERSCETADGAGLEPELHAVTYGWRRLPEPAQRALHALDPLGSRPRVAPFGHTLMLIARRP